MATIFIAIYRFFNAHQKLLYSSMLFLFALMGYFALNVNYEEDITKFIPNSASSNHINAVFQNLKVKDKLIVILSSDNGDKAQLIETGDKLCALIDSSIGNSHIKQITSKIDGEKMLAVTDFIYDNLPIFIDSCDFAKLDSALLLPTVKEKMQRHYESLASPIGLFSKNFIFKDPLGLGNKALSRLQTMQLNGNYKVEEEHIFTQDGRSMLLFIEPRYPAGNTTENAKLVDAIENSIHSLNLDPSDNGAKTIDAPTLSAEYFGGPAVAVYNSRQIKHDTMLTLGIALLIISIVIVLSFRNKFSLLLIMLPVAFGGLFALSLLSFIKGSMSLIAIGAGSAIFGVVLSYSIHVVAHREHTQNCEEIIKEMVEPLTIGSFTTIGAFFSLVFTNSEVLQDFGWFASLTIIGTTIFCLVYLPHFLKGDDSAIKPNAFLKAVERLNAYPYEKNKYLVAAILVLSALGLYFANDVNFNADMNALSFQPKHLRTTEIKLDSVFQKEHKNIYFIATGLDEEEALQSYGKMNHKIDSLKSIGLIANYATGESLLLPPNEQKIRIERWNNYWSDKQKHLLHENIKQACANYPFDEDSFEDFWAMLDKHYTPINYACNDSSAKIYSDWITKEADITMAISQIQLKEEDKSAIYSHFDNDANIVILDKPFFASKFVSTIKEDFYFVLFVSSFIVFLALLISYGRFELALLSFTPMALSWFIILGLMALGGIEFNIVNIIISTFIFGIGDDFSIFISDGLLYEYRTGKKMFAAHKTAIFYSAFTTIVGMGALAFAQHPALQSVSFTSIIGMFAVLLIAYSIQPLIFDFFITSRTKKGFAPWTIFSLIHFLFIFGSFVLLTILLTIYASLLQLIPINKNRKEFHIHNLICKLTRYIMFISRSLLKQEKEVDETQFNRPAMIICNHQSMIDILQMLALSPKIVMITKDWVWNSPLMGRLVRMTGFFNISDGYEDPNNELPALIAKGYSIAIFPEGQRSENDSLKRFHKGAFFLADKLQLDIIPIIMTGNGQCLKKSDFMVNRGSVTIKMLPRIAANDPQWGNTYQERQKNISRYFKQEYPKEMIKNRDLVQNPYYYHLLTRNFIYKGPVTEWYMRTKVKMEHNYQLFDQLIPKKANITDIGCGYGFLDFMLTFVASERQITGIDYDEEKIEVANNSFSTNSQLKFVAQNAISQELPLSDVFIMNDMLHYMPYETQERLIENCMHHLSPDGFIIIRDGDSEKQEKHKVTKITELFSTKICKFNKTEGNLYFTSKKRITATAQKNNFSVETLDNDHYTSNTIYILKKVTNTKENE